MVAWFESKLLSAATSTGSPFAAVPKIPLRRTRLLFLDKPVEPDSPSYGARASYASTAAYNQCVTRLGWRLQHVARLDLVYRKADVILCQGLDGCRRASYIVACLSRRSAYCRCARLTTERGERSHVGTAPPLIPGPLRWIGTSCRQAVALRNNAGKASAGGRPTPYKYPERVVPCCATRPPNDREDGERRAALRGDSDDSCFAER
jgi:hypothetical protein